MSYAKKVAFTMYPVVDITRARKFYEETLGLTVSKVSADGAWIEYDLPGGGCFAITNLVPDLAPNLHSGGRIAFEVGDIQALVSKLKLEQVQFKVDLFELPTCRMAVIIDPEGNAVILHQLNGK